MDLYHIYDEMELMKSVNWLDDGEEEEGGRRGGRRGEEEGEGRALGGRRGGEEGKTGERRGGAGQSALRTRTLIPAVTLRGVYHYRTCVRNITSSFG